MVDGVMCFFFLLLCCVEKNALTHARLTRGLRLQVSQSQTEILFLLAFFSVFDFIA